MFAEVEYAFGHALVRDVAYEQLPRTVREAGDIQFAEQIAPTLLQAVEHTPGIRVTGYLSLGYTAFTINLGNANGTGNAFASPGTALASSRLLREAFELALDRKTYNRVVNLGTSIPGCTPFSPATSWFDPTIKCTPFDPAEARKLVQQSGIANPTVHVCNAGPVNGPFIQAAEQAVGFKVVIDGTCFPLTGAFDVNMLGGFGGWTDPDLNTYEWLDSQGTFNQSGYSSPRVDYLLEDARKALSIASRRKLYHDVVEQVQQDRPIIYMGYPITQSAYSDKLTGLELSPSTFYRVAFAGYKSG
jgi:peptide/nickel transport system substrate-binding protein